MMRTGKSHDNSKKPAGREARLAAALRENLRRRKAQERGRGAPAEPDTRDEPGKASDRQRIR